MRSDASPAAMWLEQTLSLGGKLHGKELIDRKVLFYMNSVCTVAGIAFAPLALQSTFIAISFVIGVVPNTVIAGLCLCRVPLPRGVVRAQVASYAVGVIFMDLNMRAIGNAPVWPLFVLLADLSLVVNLGRGFATSLIVAAAMWVALNCVENTVRFGLYDLPGLTPTGQRWSRLHDMASCRDPPCPVGAAKGAYEGGVSLMVLLVDFFVTRGFAKAAEEEQAAMAHTIETVDAIAQLLAGYDVDTVADMLQEAEGRLPATMRDALRHLEQNLRAYRPYLPKSCLPHHPLDDPDHLDCSGVSSRTSKCSSFAMEDSKVLGILRTVRATLLVVNTRNALPCLEQDPREFTSFFEVLLGTTMSQVESRRGMVDVFVGDRILASFNASRPCRLHGAAAAGAALAIIQAAGPIDNTPTSAGGDCVSRADIGAASGRVLCGDTGCTEMRRFSLLGTLPTIAYGMERAACFFGLGVVCNALLHRDVDHEYTTLLVPRTVHLMKAHKGKPLHVNITCLVYELRAHAGARGAADPQEWMYEIGKMDTWLSYNTAVHEYLEGADEGAAASRAGKHQAAVRASIRLLGAPAPLDVQV